MNNPDELVWVCSDCGLEYGEETQKAPTLYTGFACSWCDDDEKVVMRPEAYGLPYRTRGKKK